MFVRKVAEEDNNLQGQGFVLQVQRTAHIEKWTKCYSKNLPPPPSINIYNIYMYVYMYLYIYSFSVFNLFFFHERRTIPIVVSSTVVANTLVVIVVSNFPIFKALEIARSDCDMLLGVSQLYT